MQRTISWRPHRFYVRGKTLVKDYPFPFAEKWRLDLSDRELQLLRFLYHPRTVAAVVERFQKEMSKTEIDQTLRTHVGLRSVLQHGRHYLAVFNDPEALDDQPLVAGPLPAADP